VWSAVRSVWLGVDTNELASRMSEQMAARGYTKTAGAPTGGELKAMVVAKQADDDEKARIQAKAAAGSKAML
jgi:hypothetical protein